MKNIKYLIFCVFVGSMFFISCRTAKQNDTDAVKTQYMLDMYNDLQEQLAPNDVEVKIINDSIKVIFKDGLLFKTGETEIVEEMYPCFTRFANVLNRYLNTDIIITGHTDNTGTYELNKKLSNDRAKSAEQLLIKNNVSEKRLTPFGQGSIKPIADNSTEEGRSLNRRVEFIILYNIVRVRK